MLLNIQVKLSNPKRISAHLINTIFGFLSQFNANTNDALNRQIWWLNDSAMNAQRNPGELYSLKVLPIMGGAQYSSQRGGAFFLVCSFPSLA